MTKRESPSGDWGDAGAAVDILWVILDENGDEVYEGRTTVEIPPDHDALIRDAIFDSNVRQSARDAIRRCDHDWTSEGEGGCRENPGVWSTGGTTIVYHAHCTLCGLRRLQVSLGSQRNPGDTDTVEYSIPTEGEPGWEEYEEIGEED